MPHVFISYVREDAVAAQRLASALKAAGVEVWLDRDRLTPGVRWQAAIRQAIEHGAFFIACFSEHSATRERSYMNEELVIAIEELRKRPRDRAWFLPVLLSPGALPTRPIGGGETLHDIHYVELQSNWDDGLMRLLSVIRSEPRRGLQAEQQLAAERASRERAEHEQAQLGKGRPRPTEQSTSTVRSARLALPPSGARLRVVGAAITGIGVVIALSVGALSYTSSPGKSPTHGTRTIYSSLPLQGVQREQTLDLVRGIKLALKEAGNKAGPFTIKYVSMDDSSTEAGTWTAKKVAANARAAAQDKSTAAYIGQFNSGASAISIPILSDAHVPQISPSNTTVGLTSNEPGAEPGTPQKHYPSGFRNYVRLVPRDTVQGAALATMMQKDGCQRVAMANDRALYARDSRAASGSPQSRRV
jgi:hypothetical protein